jgi:hypothetical protein
MNCSLEQRNRNQLLCTARYAGTQRAAVNTVRYRVAVAQRADERTVLNILLRHFLCITVFFAFVSAHELGRRESTLVCGSPGQEKVHTGFPFNPIGELRLNAVIITHLHRQIMLLSLT